MIPLPEGTQHVLYGVLDWGLGHATRSIPIIDYLLLKDIKVTIATDGQARQCLRDRYRDLDFVELKSYGVTYKGDSLLSIVTRNIPNVLAAIISENRRAKKLVKQIRPDLIISDSRFGFRSKDTPSYILTHQLNLQADNSIMKALLNTINTMLLNGFDLCLIPDTKNSTLSGELSKNNRIRDKSYIGPLSRLEEKPVEKKYFLSIILSGPEPARTKLENALIPLLSKIKKRTLLIRGVTTGLKKSIDNYNLEIINRADSNQVNDAILASEHIICRSGYSSVMDLYSIAKGAYLIPTPGQTEQEYLADYLHGKNGFFSYKQDSLQELYDLILNI